MSPTLLNEFAQWKEPPGPAARFGLAARQLLPSGGAR